MCIILIFLVTTSQFSSLPKKEMSSVVSERNLYMKGFYWSLYDALVVFSRVYLSENGEGDHIEWMDGGLQLHLNTLFAYLNDENLNWYDFSLDFYDTYKYVVARMLKFNMHLEINIVYPYEQLLNIDTFIEKLKLAIVLVLDATNYLASHRSHL